MEKHLKKAKTWNMVLIVLTLISVVTGLAGLPKSLNPKMSDYKMLGDYGQQMFDYLNSPITKIISVLSLVITIALLVFYFRANKKLADEIAPTKVPYYVYIGWSMLGLVINLMMQPKMQMEGMDFTLVTAIIGIVFQVIFLIPAILVIVHLFKAEPEE
ncbi:hypothetical protein [Enterococcus malodoratus]|uniref:DUF1648 domain-containing protein n=1 Tax=Enterococcus malodoratus ATCC 43197 TaxID=1158601 RepID=R2RBL2_9ENTE|nr:hypothetical protein [Enterococcus malodoratus]EOH81080.1 hypothetical protein UAI_01124 [Enterococcus malodoratus ATCC 43197]EOT69590.1 hypothetical protein I585_01056 [Enterococcus malodoratus ATCC 43197]OJG65322.1 hypothetical protein RV07_GL003084 [Enterococcus malodoratus]SPX01231.1 Uncharacterised protein [Enterococcus malodoratus]STC71056.1 Uncharacterised protein [Enterococcus malodoratus]